MSRLQGPMAPGVALVFIRGLFVSAKLGPGPVCTVRGLCPRASQVFLHGNNTPNRQFITVGKRLYERFLVRMGRAN